MLLVATCVAAVALGAILPLRWGVFGFVGAAALLFVVQVAVRAGMGYAGSSIEESLILFNGSWLSYIGFNMQVSYRAFAPVLLALAVTFIFRLRR